MQTINTLIEKRSTLYIVYRKCTANCKVELRDYRDSVMSSYIIENLHFSRAHVRLYLYVDPRIHARFNLRSFKFPAETNAAHSAVHGNKTVN